MACLRTYLIIWQFPRLEGIGRKKPGRFACKNTAGYHKTAISRGSCSFWKVVNNFIQNIGSNLCDVTLFRMIIV